VSSRGSAVPPENNKRLLAVGRRYRAAEVGFAFTKNAGESATQGIAIHQLRLFTNDLDMRKVSQVDLAPGFTRTSEIEASSDQRRTTQRGENTALLWRFAGGIRWRRATLGLSSPMIT
jgi:hypothetical protein